MSTSASFNEATFAEKLSKLNATQQSIESLSHWCILHRKRAKEIVTAWEKEFHSAQADRKLPFLYLANDILQNSRKKGPEFIQEFWLVLPGVVQELVKNGTESVKKSTLRMVGIWEDRRVFGSKEDSLQVLLLGELAPAPPQAAPPADSAVAATQGGAAAGRGIGAKVEAVSPARVDARGANGGMADSLPAPLRGPLERLASVYSTVHEASKGEEAAVRRCSAAMNDLQALERQMAAGGPDPSERGQASERLDVARQLLASCKEQMASCERKRSLLVKLLADALKTQESKLERLRNQMEICQASTELASRLRVRLLTAPLSASEPSSAPSAPPSVSDPSPSPSSYPAPASLSSEPLDSQASAPTSAAPTLSSPGASPTGTILSSISFPPHPPAIPPPVQPVPPPEEVATVSVPAALSVPAAFAPLVAPPTGAAPALSAGGAIAALPPAFPADPGAIAAASLAAHTALPAHAPAAAAAASASSIPAAAAPGAASGPTGSAPATAAAAAAERDAKRPKLSAEGGVAQAEAAAGAAAPQDTDPLKAALQSATSAAEAAKPSHRSTHTLASAAEAHLPGVVPGMANGGAPGWGAPPQLQQPGIGGHMPGAMYGGQYVSVEAMAGYQGAGYQGMQQQQQQQQQAGYGGFVQGQEYVNAQGSFVGMQQGQGFPGFPGQGYPHAAQQAQGQGQAYGMYQGQFMEGGMQAGMGGGQQWQGAQQGMWQGASGAGYSGQAG